MEGNIIGAMNIGFGRPIGRIEMLCLDKSITVRQRGRAATKLFEKATSLLRESGSQIVMSLISDRNERFQKLVARHGAQAIDEGKFFVYLL